MKLEVALRIQTLALQAIESVTAVLNTGIHEEDPVILEKFRGAVGEILITIDSKLLAEIYKSYPEIDDLK